MSFEKALLRFDLLIDIKLFPDSSTLFQVFLDMNLDIH